MKKILKQCVFAILFVLLVVFHASLSYALPFSITVRAGSTLPTNVVTGFPVPALYTVANNTQQSTIGDFVKYLPPNVTQVTVDATYPDLCGATFNLTPTGTVGSSCTLELMVSGAVNGSDPNPHNHLFVCFSGGLTCAGTPNGLNVTNNFAPTINSLSIYPATTTIQNGSQQQYTAVAALSDGTTTDVTSSTTWTSTNTSVATINSTGLATSVAAGSTTINATATLNGSTGTDSANLTVNAGAPVLVSIAIEPGNPEMHQNTILRFKATGTYSDGSIQDITTSVTWASTATSVVSIVAGTGVATAGATPGSTVISATSGAISNSVTVNVSSATLSSLQIFPGAPYYNAGSQLQFYAYGLYSDSSIQDLTYNVTWGSSDAGNLSISNAAGTEGLSTTSGPGGTITITATLGLINNNVSVLQGALSATSSVVTPALPTLHIGTRLQLFSATIFLGLPAAYRQYSTSLATWSSGTPAVATVSNASATKGLVTALTTGTTLADATFAGGLGSTTVTVNGSALTSLQITATNSTVHVGTRAQYRAIGTFADASTQDLTNFATWTSNDTAVATVSNNIGAQGMVSGVAAGSTLITATVTLNGASVAASANETTSAATYVSGSITPASGSVAAPNSVAYTLTGTFSDGLTQDLTGMASWYTSNLAVAFFNPYQDYIGQAVGFSAGSTTVTAQFFISGVSQTSTASITVT